MPKPKATVRPSQAQKGSSAPSPTEEALSAISATVAAARRRISSQDRRFVDLYADSGFKDAYSALKAAGFKKPGKVDQILARLAPVIDQERLRRSLSSQMELEEALVVTAGLARTCEDPKVKLAALRTVLEVHGALGSRPLPTSSRTELARQVAEIVERVGRRVGANPGASARVRAILTATDSSSSAAVEVEERSPRDEGPAPHPPQPQLPS